MGINCGFLCSAVGCVAVSCFSCVRNQSGVQTRQMSPQKQTKRKKKQSEIEFMPKSYESIHVCVVGFSCCHSMGKHLAVAFLFMFQWLPKVLCLGSCYHGYHDDDCALDLLTENLCENLLFFPKMLLELKSTFKKKFKQINLFPDEQQCISADRQSSLSIKSMWAHFA